MIITNVYHSIFACTSPSTISSRWVVAMSHSLHDTTTTVFSTCTISSPASPITINWAPVTITTIMHVIQSGARTPTMSSSWIVTISIFGLNASTAWFITSTISSPSSPVTIYRAVPQFTCLSMYSGSSTASSTMSRSWICTGS